MRRFYPARRLLTAALLAFALLLAQVATAADPDQAPPPSFEKATMLLEQLDGANGLGAASFGAQTAGNAGAAAVRDALPDAEKVKARYGRAAGWAAGALRDTAADSVSGSALQGMLNGAEPAAGDFGGRMMRNMAGRAIDDAVTGARATGLPFLRNLEAEYQLQEHEKPQYSLRAIDAIYESADLRHTLFSEGGLAYRDGRTTTNLGGGYRWMGPNEHWLYGVNGFYDQEWEYGHRRLSLGLEATSTIVRMFANRYVALSGWQDTRPGYEEIALSGWDFGLSGRMPFLPELEATGTAFTWQRHDALDDLKGLRLNLDYTPTPKVTLGLSTTQNSDGDTDLAMAVRYNFNAAKTEQEIHPESVRDLRLKRVNRENTIVTQERLKSAAAAALGITVQETTGSNQVTDPDGVTSNLSVGQTIRYGSHITVSGAVGDYAQLAFSDGGILRIGTNSAVDIVTGQIQLVSGVIQYVSGATHLTVSTPGGTITLTGTDIDVYSAGAGSTVRVRDGQIDANGTAVQAGQIAQLTGSTTILTPAAPAYDQHRQEIYTRLDRIDPSLLTVAKAAPYVYRDVYVQTAPAQTGDPLVLALAFSKPVTHTGPVTLDFTLNGASRTAGYLSGDGTNTLLFRYVTTGADAGEDTADIDDFSLNGGSVKAGAMNAVIYVPATSAPFPGGPITPATVTASVTSAAGSTTAISPIPFTITFSEAVTGLTLGGLAVGNGTAGNLATSDNITWTVDVTPAALGPVTLQVTAGAAQSSGGGNNTASNTASVTYNTGAPTGYSVAFVTNPVDAANAASAAFDLAGATVGAAYNYSITSSGGGTAVTGTGTVTAATMNFTGIDLSGLGDGTLTLSLTLANSLGDTGIAATDTVTKDTTPTGYSVAFTTTPIDAANAGAAAFALTGATVGATYDYSITSSGGGTAVTGSGTVTAASMNITGIDLSALPDGTITLSLTLTTASGGTGAAATDTAPKDTTPTGYAVAFVTTPVNYANASAAAFDLTGAQVGAAYSYSISSSGGGTAVTGTGTVGAATMHFTGIDLSGLGDGTLTLTMTLTSAVGSAGAPVTATATKDITLPVPAGYSVAFTTAPLTLANVGAAAFDLTSAEVGDTYNYSITSSGGGTPVTGTGTVTAATMNFTGLDLSALPDGTITLSLTLTNALSVTGAAATDTTTKATTPTGYSVDFTTDPLTAANTAAAAFTLAGAQVGATYNYTISSSGGGTPVSASGTVSSATQAFNGIDLTGLADGTVTLSLTLTNSIGETGATATDSVAKATVPTGYAVAITSAPLSSANAAAASFDLTGANAGDTYNYSFSSSDGGAPVTGSGTASAGTTTVSGINLSALPDGTITLSLTLTNSLGITGAAVTDTTTKATTPSGYAVAFTTTPVNAGNVAAAAFSLTAAEVGTTYSYTITSSGGGTPVSATGTVSTATQAFTNIDLSGLADGTLTLSLTLSSVSGSTGAAATATAPKDTVIPTITSVTPPADGTYDDL